METDLSGKVAIISGATSGIGQALARRLADRGVKLGLLARGERDSVVPGAIQRAIDVRDFESLQSFSDEVSAEFGSLDIVIANAGVGHYADFLETPRERVLEMIETNFLGTVNLVQATLPIMVRHGKGGDVVAIASEAGRRGLPGEAVYSASKFGQVGLMRALDNEMRENGIRVTNICPGGVATEFAVGNGRGREKGSEQLTNMMTAEDIADVGEFVLGRPRGHRILEVAMRPMSEPSWG
ncbi:SDR family oxidoreductase [Nesterenkonia ebinurensis]|uniref:SDR family oxidoreductase n=1 Tax=Nesterenkonia ebinurensis TaxID=2608252 RepID=UPI00123CBF2C|nr:SDR family oxidoreductase [Nesterenkonia ebinurensis]